ncbi:MAG: hypothetical protein ACRDNJ_15990 [Solirubrobacteraceae bacterium]
MPGAKEHQRLMTEAIERDGDGQRVLLAGDGPSAAKAFAAAAELYRRSWEAAPPTGYGRLVGLLKAAILAGGGEREAAYVRGALPTGADGSATAAYALAIAALVLADDDSVGPLCATMRAGSDAFDRTAAALAALADRDGEAYRAALIAIIADFAARERHLTGVAIADTAVMLERLAAPRGLATGIESPLLPAPPTR